MTCDLANFEDQKLMQLHQDDTIRSAFGQEKRPQGIGKVWYNFVVDDVAELFYLNDVRYCPHLDIKSISLSLLDQKSLTYSAQQGEIRIQYEDRTVIPEFKNENNLYSVNLEPLPKLQKGKTWACISKQNT